MKFRARLALGRGRERGKEGERDVQARVKG
jgi:hypothetical protein